MSKEKDKKKETICVRCTAAERLRVKTEQMTYGYHSESTYVRMLLFGRNRIMDGRVVGLLRKIEWDNVKIGTNINQIAKVCNAKKFATEEELIKIRQEMRLLNLYFEQLHEDILKLQTDEEQEGTDGNYKIIEN